MTRALSDQRFLAIRSLVVELSAAFDRVERHAAEESVDTFGSVEDWEEEDVYMLECRYLEEAEENRDKARRE